MEGKRRVPYGTISYGEIANECYFVDHTRFIRELEPVKTPVFLRPKRFGKSYICTMLAYYYDLNRKADFEHYFGNTDIGKNPTPLANSFLVLKFDFSTITVGTLAAIERDFTKHVREQVEQFVASYRDLVNDRGESVQWPDLAVCQTAASIIDAVRSVIKSNRLPPLYAIIDEYDNFTNELVVSNRERDYDAICGHDNLSANRESFFKAFFKSFKAGLADETVARTYFTGVLPITLDDLSSGFNVGTVVSLEDALLSLAGFTQSEVEKYVDEIIADNGFDPTLRKRILADLKAFYDGYRFTPEAEPLYNSTITNWYLRKFQVNGGKIPWEILDSNVRTDIGWFRKLAGSNEFALERVRAYVERGEGERATRTGLSAKFGRAKFFSKEFFPYALYYLGLLTFENPFRLGVPNLTIKNMFVDYYDELMDFHNEDVARTHFVDACEALALNGGTWRNVFERYWQYYVKARIPAQAYDQMNENFFRLTFTSRSWDALPMYYSFEQEYNTPEGRIDFLATPKPGTGLAACMIEYKYFHGNELAAIGVKTSEDGKCDFSGRTAPDDETLKQARRYAASLPKRPGWEYPIECVVVEVYSHYGYQWFNVCV